VNNSDKAFRNAVVELFNVPAVIDYYLLISLLCAVDNG
jgi:hypothetical protein